MKNISQQIVCQVVLFASPHNSVVVTAEELFGLLEVVDAIRRPQRIIALTGLFRLIDSFEGQPSPQRDLWEIRQKLDTVETSTLVLQGFQGKALGAAIRQARIKAIDSYISAL